PKALTCSSRKCARWASTSSFRPMRTKTMMKVPKPFPKPPNKIFPHSSRATREGKMEQTNEPAYQLHEPGRETRNLRHDQDRHREPGTHPFVVVRRDQEARNDQLSHVQARARRPVLRAHLWSDQGL